MLAKGHFERIHPSQINLIRVKLTHDSFAISGLISSTDIPGVKGDEQRRVQSPPARISLCTSPSHPSFTPSMLSRPRYIPVTGVGKTRQLDGGLLVALPEKESGGVDG